MPDPRLRPWPPRPRPRLDPKHVPRDDPTDVEVPDAPAAGPTRVYAYLVDPVTGETGAFVDYGSLVTSTLVALHTEVDRPWQPPWDQLRDQVRGDLHELEATARVARGPVRGPAMRCLLVGSLVEVLEGDGLVDGSTSPGTLTGVSLRGQSWQEVDPVPVPQGVAVPDQQVQAAIASWVAQARDDDPVSPPYPPPAPPALPNDDGDNSPGKKPWYCSVWAGAPGCR